MLVDQYPLPTDIIAGGLLFQQFQQSTDTQSQQHVQHLQQSFNYHYSGSQNQLIHIKQLGKHLNNTRQALTYYQSNHTREQSKQFRLFVYDKMGTNKNKIDYALKQFNHVKDGETKYGLDINCHSKREFFKLETRANALDIENKIISESKSKSFINEQFNTLSSYYDKLDNLDNFLLFSKIFTQIEYYYLKHFINDNDLKQHYLKCIDLFEYFYKKYTEVLSDIEQIDIDYENPLTRRAWIHRASKFKMNKMKEYSNDELKSKYELLKQLKVVWEKYYSDEEYLTIYLILICKNMDSIAIEKNLVCNISILHLIFLL